VLDLGNDGIFVAGATYGQVGVAASQGHYDLFIHKFVDDKIDTDGDGTTNFLDTDDDNDGINDADELLIGTDTSLQDTNGDGTADGAGDFDGDGIDNATESNASLGTQTDIDGDSSPDIITP
jgi:heat shock protein beta